MKCQSSTNARPRQGNEPLEVYAAELCCLVHTAFPDDGEAAVTGEILRFIVGLDPVMQAKLYEHGVATTLLASERARSTFLALSPSPVHTLMSPSAVYTLSIALSLKVDK